MLRLKSKGGVMLQKLAQVKAQLKDNLGAVSEWNSLYIDYEKPTVERLWRQEGEFRICLHKIHPCENSTFFHSHKWPSAMQLLGGSYLMGVGKSESIGVMPSVDKVLHLKAGDSYEMLSELDWHYVQPVNECSYSIMIIGTPFHPHEGKTHAYLSALSDQRKDELLDEFKEIFARE
jgi:hypothetical protein